MTTLPQPSQLRDWHGKYTPYFERCSEDAVQTVKRFMQDWGYDAGIRVVGEPSVRIKSVERIWSKLRRKASSGDVRLVTFDDLLDQGSLTGDLVGVRLVVRGLADLQDLHNLMVENDFLGESPFQAVAYDAKYLTPTQTGYRALHINSCDDVTIRGRSALIPLEIQVKTGLQDHWGTFTHDTAYELVDLHEDPEFLQLRNLQRLLADSLDVADQLNRSVETLYASFVQRRGALALTGSSDLSVDAVLRVFSDVLGSVVSVEDARRVHDAGVFSGLSTVDDLRDIMSDEDNLESLAGEVQALESRAPSPVELVIRAIERRL